MTYRRQTVPSRQHGVVLFVSLIMLVALTLAGLAVMRGVSAGVQITRNVVFKQGATASADRGIEAARKWLIDNKAGTTLNSDSTANGYFATYVDSATLLDSFNAITYDWTGTNKSVLLAADGAGNTVRYVIHRLCQTANAAADASGQKCVAKSGSTTGGGGVSQGDLLAGGQNLEGKITAYYRITARAEGPMSTVAYVQAMID